jgi:hypothetical protein
MQLLERLPAVDPAPAATPPDVHCDRLLDLFHRWCREAENLGRRLATTERRLELSQRSAHDHRLALVPDRDARESCDDLQALCDHLAEELAHLRLALVGTAEEIDRTLSLIDAAQPA